MPELPEVETICQSLQGIIGKKIVNVIKNRNDLRFILPNFKKIEGDCHVKAVSRQAKVIRIFFSNEQILLIGLGMTGRLILQKKNSEMNENSHEVKYSKHNHVIFEFDDGDRLIYNDIRRFGFMEICHRNVLNESKSLAKIGIEPLSQEFTGAWLFAKCQKSSKPIKNFLMTNEIIVGVGNIYASESLFESHILPTRIAKTLSQKECERLAVAIKNVLQCAIASGGSSLKDYANADGQTGYFQHSFKVYGRDGEKCNSCGDVLQKIKQLGRSSFFCKFCQK